MKKLFVYLMVFSLSTTLMANKNEVNSEMNKTSKTIVELAVENGFNSLAVALTKADLIEPLNSKGSFTVFAPTDAAFANLLAAVGQKSLDDVPVSVLKQILLYHVIQGEVTSSQIKDGNANTLEGTSIKLTTAGGIKVNGVSVVSPFDVKASNGVIHTVDQVLVPASIAQFVNTVLEPAFFNKSFSTLVGAVVKADVVSVLLNTPNLTIFAPDNAAFLASGIDPVNIDAKTLASVLTYHVVGAKVLSSGIPKEAATVNGQKLFFSSKSSGSYINEKTKITAVDIESGSGVVHVIDHVLLPK
ncbi:MAG: fasciclin domain-containing protein [Bacteroidetes bacterium]|nr:fasciclin domain-containing protein [Bacteroidota bacterium]